MKDMNKDHRGLWTAPVSFPLERLHDMLSKGIWIDAQSESVWTAELGIPTLDDRSYPDRWASHPPRNLDPQTQLLPWLGPRQSSSKGIYNRFIHECQGIDTSTDLQNAISRYHKFLRLMPKEIQNHGGKHSPRPDFGSRFGMAYTPTLSAFLRAYCLEFVGRMVNHDDTFEKVVIGNRLRETNLAWLKAYHEPYTIKDLRKEFCTTKGKIVGVMFPPYGIVIFQKVTFINLTIKSPPQLQKIWFQGIV